MKSKQTPQKLQEFGADPFKALKGIAVAPPRNAPSPALKPPPKALLPPLEEESDDDLTLFFRAVTDVRPLAAADPGDPPQEVSAVGTPLALRARTFEEEDRKLFLKSLEGMTVRFQDEIPDGEEALRPISAGRLKQLKQGTIRIRMELDLHGLGREQAVESLARFIDGAWQREMKAVLVITGKGNNSPGEPILQGVVAGWLQNSGKKMIAEFAPAPRQMGGSGAFVVFLRSREKETSGGEA